MEGHRQSVASSAPAGGARYVGSWALGHRIGSGSFAVVWKAVHKVTGEVAAVKEIWTEKLNKKLQESLESEMSILSRTHHENIVQLKEIIKEKDKGRIYLVMEFCAGGDLSGLLRRVKSLPEPAVRQFMQQLAAALKELRSLNLIHRDLKPQNLLLSHSGPDATLKLADFGFARNLQPQGLAETLCGSPLYMAPEILQFHKYDAKADLWSVGAILFEMVVGQTPFSGRNHVELLRNIERHEARLPVASAARTSVSCRQLIGGLLKRNPVERIGFDEFFSHQFLVGGGSERDAAVVATAEPTEPRQHAQRPAASFGRAPTAFAAQRVSADTDNPLFLKPDDQGVRPGIMIPGQQQQGLAAVPVLVSFSPGSHQRQESAPMGARARTQGAAELGAGIPTPSSTPVSTNSFMPSSLPRIQVAAIWDALAHASGRSQRAANAADQLCEQFSEPHERHKLVQLEASGSSGSLSDFERDFVVISSVPDEPPGDSSSNFSDGAHANAAIANATIGKADPRAQPSSAARRPPPPSAPSGPPAAQPPLTPAPSHPLEPLAGQSPPTSTGAPLFRPSASPTAHPPPLAPPRAAPAALAATASQSHQQQQQLSGGPQCLQGAARLLLDLAAARASAGTCDGALVLCDLALQALAAAAAQADSAPPELTAAMSSALDLAQEAAEALQSSGGAPDAELPCPLDLAYRLAVDYGRAGAVDELMSNHSRSANEYGAAITLFTFLLTEVPRLPPSGLRLPRNFPPAEERRLRRYLSKLQVRCAACASLAKSSPGSVLALGGAGVSPGLLNRSSAAFASGYP